MDNPLTNGSKNGLKELLEELRDVAYETNKEWADRLGIPPGKQGHYLCQGSGTVSQLVDSGTGIHAVIILFISEQ